MSERLTFFRRYDASGKDDEPLSSDGEEYSDDDEEAAARQRRKVSASRLFPLPCRHPCEDEAPSCGSDVGRSAAVIAEH